MTIFTTPFAVNGRLHLDNNLEALFLEAVCSIVTITLEPHATRSMAPPIPLTSFLGIIQLAISHVSLTSMAPSIVKSKCPPLIIAKDCDEEKYDAPGNVVTVSYVIKIIYFSSIDQIWVLFSFDWVRTNSEYSVLALQIDFHIRG